MAQPLIRRYGGKDTKRGAKKDKKPRITRVYENERSQEEEGEGVLSSSGTIVEKAQQESE